MVIKLLFSLSSSAEAGVLKQLKTPILSIILKPI
jgi:hypothetical protein